MSHFAVIVCLPAGAAPDKTEEILADVMEPWDENRSTEPYRDYEDGSPEDYWWVKAVRRGAQSLREGKHPDIRPNGFGPGDGKVWNNQRGGYITVEQAAADEIKEWEDDAIWADRLGEHPDWETVARLYNEKYHPGNELAVPGDASDSERLHYDADDGRAYTWSTCNPESKWDYWRIGGRWKDYFVAKGQAAGLIWSEKSWDSPDAKNGSVLRCDGGPIAALDLEAMRAEAEREANARYDQWETVAAEHEPAKAWSHFRGLAELGEITWDEARRQYNAQPLVRAADEQKLAGWGDCVVEEFLPPRDEYVAEARRGAVPAYALVTLDREWVAPGRMGWFGMSSDGPGERSGYRVAVNTYLDQLDPATVLVILDCHV